MIDVLNFPHVSWIQTDDSDGYFVICNIISFKISIFELNAYTSAAGESLSFKSFTTPALSDFSVVVLFIEVIIVPITAFVELPLSVVTYAVNFVYFLEFS